MIDEGRKERRENESQGGKEKIGKRRTKEMLVLIRKVG